jgi:hypothetical protein
MRRKETAGIRTECRADMIDGFAEQEQEKRVVQGGSRKGHVRQRQTNRRKRAHMRGPISQEQ